VTRRFFRATIICLALYWLLICTLTHLPPADMPHVEVNDKIEHFAAFALLGFLLNAVLREITRRHADWLTLATILLYGALDEWLQPLTGRSCEFNDWMADGAGAAVAVVLLNLTRLVWQRVTSPSSTLVEDHRTP
jgi:VanZ family protein